MASSAIHSLSVSVLEKLRHDFLHGNLAHGITATALKQTAPDLNPDSIEYLLECVADGWSAGQLAELLAMVRDARETRIRDTHLFDLVISGPETAAVPTRDTATVYRELIASAETEVVLVSYAIHNGKEIFHPLVQRMAARPDLKVTLYLDIPRGRNDTTLSDQIVATYRHDFLTKQWPSPTLPKIFYHKPSLEMDWKTRSSMHAKVVIIDRLKAFVTSANLTGAAQSKNIEIGTLIESESHATRLVEHFEGLRNAGVFVEF